MFNRPATKLSNQLRLLNATNAVGLGLESLEDRRLLSAWGAQATIVHQDAAAANFPTIDGRGESIAVIDTGVDYNHWLLGGGFGPGHKVIAGYDFVDNDSDPMDTIGHGTGSASVLAGNAFDYNGQHYQGIAPGANIIALRENGDNGILSSMQWVLAHRTQYNIVAVELVNYGGQNPGIYLSSEQQLEAAGVFFGSPSGNYGQVTNALPTIDSKTVQTGSVNLSGQISSFTERGQYMSLLGVGEGVVLPYMDPSNGNAVIVNGGVGTSWASPQVVGTAALIKQINPNFSVDQVRQIMMDSGTSTWDSATGRSYPLLNIDAALRLAYQRSGQASLVTPAPVPAPPTPTVNPKATQTPTPTPTPTATPSPTPTATPTPTPTPSPTPISTTKHKAHHVTAPTASPTVTSTRTTHAIKATAFADKPASLSGYIQAEKFDNGGEGVGYHDADTTNTGGVYRNDSGVDVFASRDTSTLSAHGLRAARHNRDGTDFVGMTQAGEWLNYTVASGKTQTYNLSVRVASLGQGGTFHIEIDGVDETGAISVPDTHGWRNWQVITTPAIQVAKGTHTLKIVMDTENATTHSVGNFDWIAGNIRHTPSFFYTPQKKRAA